MSDQTRQTSGYASRRRSIGSLIEARIAERYNLTLDHSGRADARYENGTPVEVKAAMRRKKNGRGGYRPGVFKLFRGPHSWVLDRSGYYIFCVYVIRSDQVRIKATKRVPASDLPHFSWGDPSSNPNRDFDSMALFSIEDIFG